MNRFLPNFNNTNILVVGDLMLDRYWQGNTSRVSPEAPVPVVHVKTTEERAGGAGNVALNIAALGGHVQLLGLVGEDEAGSALQKHLIDQSVACHFISHKDISTIVKLRVVSRHQQLIRLDFEDNSFTGYGQKLSGAMHNLLQQTDVVIFSDYGKGTLENIAELISICKQAGITSLVDPKGQDFERYRGATLLTPNLSEFEAVVGHCPDNETLVLKGETLRQQLDLHALLITRSERGMTLLVENQPPLHLAARARDVFDVTGAGDTVIGVLATSLAAGQNIQEATSLANLAASIVVGKSGTAYVDPTELQNTLHPPENQRGICNTASLKERVQQAQARGETVVMTNGCFDLLHAGHIQYLAEARALGDRLIIAVNDDDSVRRLKGCERPINSLEQRMAVLSALHDVDWVIPFSEDTPADLIAQILPNILVKGGDYRSDEVAGKDSVESHGGKVVILSFQDGISTSNIVQQIRNTTTQS